MSYFAVIAALTLLLCANCAPKPTEGVDLTHARATLQLVDGSSVSSDIYDDVNPVLIQKPDGFLVLLFASNRDCAYTCTGYNIFIAESIEPVYDPYDLPAFNFPEPLNEALAPLDISTGRFPFHAAWYQNQIRIYYDAGGSIYSARVNPGNIVDGMVGQTPSAVGNSSHNADRLVSVDFRTLRMTTVDGPGDAYESLIDSVDSGTLLGNYELGDVTSAANVSPTISGYTDAKIYNYNGEVAYGFNDSPGDYMYSLNAALADAALDLSYVSTYETELPFINGLLFSAGDSGQHDLYAVDSHTLDELWFLDADYGFTPFNFDNFNIFVSDLTPDGFLGGVYGADAFCNFDPNRPVLSSYYSAMIVDSSGTRTACTSANCGTSGTAEHVDWPLYENTAYIQAGTGNEIGITDIYGLLSSMAIAIDLATSQTAWTGFSSSADWTSDPSNTCLDWYSNSGGDFGSVGATDSNITASIYSSSSTTCDTAIAMRLYCVEQPY
jgi:hypothetical protein